MPLRAPPDGGDKVAKGSPHERRTEYGTFSASSELKDTEKSAASASQKRPNPASANATEKSLPSLHPESPATAWWRKLFFEFFDKKQLDSELDASQVWELTAEHTSAEAAAAFRQVCAQSRQGRSRCRIKSAIIRTHWWKLVACWALQLASLLCDACTPVLLYMLLAMAISREYTQTQIYALLGLLYVTALGEVLLHCHSHFMGFKINIKIVGALRALVFENTISQPEHIPGHAVGSYDSESGKKRMAEVAHLYAEDVANVARMVTHMQFLWRSVLQIIFELCILVQVIGIRFKPVAIAFLFMAVFAKFLSAAGSRLQRKLQKKIEARLNVIHECFKGIQMVKLNAWEDKMQCKIEHARKEENRERRRVNVVAALQYCVGVDSPNLASIFIFGWVALQDTSALSPARVFPALLLLRRIKTHFSNTARLFDVASKGQASLCKIDCYLNECDVKSCAQNEAEKTRDMQLSNVGSNGPETVMAMEHACFGQSSEEGKALLANVSFRLRRGQLAMLQGKAGAGKSTLLNALLGNTKCIDGDVFVAQDCKIAYCAQEPWLQTLSIRDNILFGSEFDSQKYWCVVEACCLKDDLRMLPEGDSTHVGPKGINLSGGQKARIALARACYADADIYLLDCPFASVDAIVQNEIFTKCIVELLRFKTVLMVTHNRELSSSSFVDHVLRVKDLTVVVESAEKGWDVGRHPSRRVDPRNSLPPWRGESKQDGQKKSAQQPRGLALWQPVALPLSSAAVLVKPVASKAVATSSSTQVPVTSECVGIKVARKFKWKEEWFSLKTWKMLLKGGKCMRHHVPAKFFLFLYAFAVTSKDVFLMKWSDRVDHGDVSNMDGSAKVYGVLVLSSMVSGFASSVLHAHAMANSANRMFHEMTAALLRAPMTFFYSTPVGELFNRYFNDIRVLDTTFALAFMAMFRSAVTILAADGILWYFTGVAGTSIILIVLYVVKEFMTLGFLVGLLRLSFRAEAANLNFISEALDGSATIRAFGRQQINRFRVEHGVLSDELMKGQYHTEVFNRFVLIRCDRVLGIHMLLLMFLLSMHNISPAELGLMLYYVFTINSDVYTLSSKLLEVALCLLNVERVRKYGLIEPELQSYEGNPLTIPASWPHRGDVVFEKVSFSYASSSSDEKAALALCDVSFSVKGGEKVGVVGRTGSGKSSLAMALFRVHPLTKGRIIVDGLDASLLSLSALRTNVCIIPQSPLFYRCSVRNYLDPFNEFGDVALLNALRRCGLKGSMANLEAELSDNGENWSLGERQMLCLARAVLRPARIVVLDESFSAVDQANQSTLLNVLDTAFRDSTLFLITHRLDDVLQFDNILVMKEGRAVEFGPAEDLAADPGSAFYEFLETTLLTY